MPGLVAQQVLGIFAPASDIERRSSRKIAEANDSAMADSAYQTIAVDQAVIPLTDWTPERFNQFMAEDVARWSPLVKAIGVRLD